MRTHLLLSALAGLAFLPKALPSQAPSWTTRTPLAAPPARSDFAMCYDSTRRLTVLFGGYYESGGNVTAFNDTWNWNGINWVPRTSPLAPSARWGHQMVYDSRRERAVLFGGFDPAAGVLRNDTWEWDGTVWSQRSPAASPPARAGHAMAYDSWRQRTVVFGGAPNISNPPSPLGDLWEWDGANWTQSLVTGPTARIRPSMSFDAYRGEMVLFGGDDGAAVLDETWIYNASGWHLRNPAIKPGPRYYAAMAYDELSGETVLCGGATHNNIVTRNDTWAWDGNSWASSSALVNPARWSASMTMDLNRGELVLFGGRNTVGGVGTFYGDTLVLSTSAQRLMSVVTPPRIGFVGQFAYSYPPSAVGQFCFHLVTAPWPGSLAVPIPGFTSIGLAQVDLFTIYLQQSVLLDASGINLLTLAIPFDPVLSGVSIDVQSVDIAFANNTLFWAHNDAAASLRDMPNPALSMVAIRPGTFQMGSNAGSPVEQPVHTVNITRPFWMGAYEVTQEQYQDVMGTNPSYFLGVRRPVDSVSWNDADSYCTALTSSEAALGRIPPGYEYRLPTEAEWEYCCRAGTTTDWNTGTSLTVAQANFGVQSGQTTDVGSYTANAWGLYDMHGNVWEVCLDAWDRLASYPSSEVADPYVTIGSSRIRRGGAYADVGNACRSAFREGINPSGTSGLGAPQYFGFRVVLAPIIP
jgi:formylglycine-generating enzyme required for sulfatase activity